MPAEEIVTLRLPTADGPILRDALSSFGRSLAADVRVVVVMGPLAGISPADHLPDDDLPHDYLPAADSADDEAALGWLRRRDLISVAVLRGEVSGGVLQVALACDLRLAADEAVLSLALDADSSPDSLGDVTGRIADLVGYAKALELVLARRVVSGRDAVRLGLVNAAVPGVQLEPTTTELTDAILATPRGQVTEVKAILTSWQDLRHARVAEVAAAIAAARGEA